MVNNMNFDSERKCFQQFKQNLTDEARQDYESAISTLIRTYNTAIRSNRFIVGGVVEVFTMALMRSAGIDVDRIASESVGGDLILPDSKMLSIKSSFTNSPIRLINTMGSSQTDWTVATLFVVAKIGIIYGDPLMVTEDDLRRPNDVLTILKGAINRLAQDENNLIPMNIPPKPPYDSSEQNDEPGIETSIAKRIAFNLNLARLSDYLDDS